MGGHYTIKSSSVRIDFFKESGKWYTTYDCDMEGFYLHPSVHGAVLAAMKKKYPTDLPCRGMTLVCMEPYHQFEHPIMIHNWDTATQ